LHEPLSGYSVLDLTELKGQFAGRLLCDLGMRVIKIEPPEGDAVRRLGPFADGRPDLETSLRFAFLNAGKYSVTLDLDSRDGRELLLRLVEQSDVLLESFPAGHMARAGLGYDQLSKHNPGLVMASVSGFGQSGPHSSYLAPDIVGLAMGGLMYISGDPNLPPVKAPETQAYYYTCVFAALGVVLALLERQSTGRGNYIDVSMQESIATQEHMIREAAFDGAAITRNGSQHKHTAPANIFPCQDGHVYLFILSARDWNRFLDLWTDHPPELDAAELKPPSNRRRHLELINPLVGRFTERYTKAALTELLQSHGIPCLPVNSPTDFLHEEHIQARELFGRSGGPESSLMLRFPVMFDGERLPVAKPPPRIGADNARIYAEAAATSPLDLQLLFGHATI
jgi:crotonobetainyl-CoA:carnitine CoA-transferase CaiB-like acyl-CoA transferase